MNSICLFWLLLCLKDVVVDIGNENLIILIVKGMRKALLSLIHIPFNLLINIRLLLDVA